MEGLAKDGAGVRGYRAIEGVAERAGVVFVDDCHRDRAGVEATGDGEYRFLADVVCVKRACII